MEVRNRGKFRDSCPRLEECSLPQGVRGSTLLSCGFEVEHPRVSLPTCEENERIWYFIQNCTFIALGLRVFNAFPNVPSPAIVHTSVKSYRRNSGSISTFNAKPFNKVIFQNYVSNLCPHAISLYRY